MIKKLIISNTIVFLFLFYSCGKGSPNSPLDDVAIQPAYTITFDLNGGSGTAPLSITGHAGKKITLPNESAMITPEAAKKFGGWSNALSSETYNGGEEYTITGDVTLEANWTSKSVSKITFDLNGGNINGTPSTIAPQEVMEGEHVGKPTVVIKKSASKFTDKWYREPSCSTEWDFSAAITSSAPQNIMLYAGYKDLTIISTANDLMDLAEIVKKGDTLSGKTITLQNDIDLTGSSFNGIAVGGGEFNGTFDGNGHTIENLEIIKTGINGVGFIGVTGTSSVITNLTIKEANVSVTGGVNIGALVGENKGVIVGSASIGGKVTSTYYHIGGIAGMNNGGTVRECYNTSWIYTQNNWAAGIVGYNAGVSSKVEDCYNLGKVSGGQNGAGIVAANEGMVKNCYNTVAVSSDNTVMDNAIIIAIYASNRRGEIIADNRNVSSVTNNHQSAESLVSQSTFSGWDFTTIWEIDTVKGRPVLKNNRE